jgi:microsomal dipeptidase-like Zn-dependent dipeptidase
MKTTSSCLLRKRKAKEAEMVSQAIELGCAFEEAASYLRRTHSYNRTFHMSFYTLSWLFDLLRDELITTMMLYNMGVLLRDDLIDTMTLHNKGVTMIQMLWNLNYTWQFAFDSLLEEAMLRFDMYQWRSQVNCIKMCQQEFWENHD